MSSCPGQKGGRAGVEVSCDRVKTLYMLGHGKVRAVECKMGGKQVESFIYLLLGLYIVFT